VTAFVPPNDARTTGKPGQVPSQVAAAIRALPDARKNRQPRTFPAMVPSGRPALVRYSWILRGESLSDAGRHRGPLARLAREVVYLGHSHSLVRVAVVDGDSDGERREGWSLPPAALRMPHGGRMTHLRERYTRSIGENRIFRPNPSLVIRRFAPKREDAPPATIFDGETATVLADAGGFAPSLSAFPLVAKRLRDALLDRAPKGGTIPTLVSGHDQDKRPAGEPHVAIVPLADVGWTHSQGRLMGVALLWPRAAAPADRRRALEIIAAFVTSAEGRRGLLHFGKLGSWSLEILAEPDRASLRFDRYARAARRWGTVLPVALDRHPKDKPGADLADVIARSCVNAGLAESALEGLDIEVHKHAPVNGAPSVAEVLRSVALDSPYRLKPFAHLVLTFSRPIRGPLVLGAGRYRGLGLCLPVEPGD
jgi:CRISPR-associated protein Csb2